MKEEDFIHFVNIVVGAYPGRMGSLQPTKEQLKALFMYNQNNDAAIHYYGLWEDNKLIGGMRLHDFEMNLFSKMIPIGGVGLVAVDLLRKKEKVAKELIDHFFKSFFREKCIILLRYIRLDLTFIKKWALDTYVF